MKEYNQDNYYQEGVSSKILFVIVIYKTKITDSLTYNSLLKSFKSANLNEKLNLLICDNSPIPQLSLPEFENNNFLNFDYIHDSSNPGTSLSYNRAASLALSKNQKWLLLLDQDTTLPNNAIGTYINTLMMYPNFPIYAPKLISENKLLSPCNYYFYRGTHLSNIGQGIYKMRNKNVLNSGLLVDVKAFNSVGGYDEKVWLYFSDFVFFNRLKSKYKEFIVIECCLAHEISSSDFTNFSFAYSRFGLYCLGARAASKSDGTIFAYFSYMAGVGMRSILMSLRFRSFSFLECFIKCFFK